MFQIGDEVELELHAAQTAPRWYYDDDRRGGGGWVRGTVLDIRARTSVPTELKIEILIPSIGIRQWFLLNLFGNQNLYPGHPQKIETCECGSDILFKGNSKGAHSDWCPKYNKVYHT